MASKYREYSDYWAKDLDNNMLSKGEIYNEQVINQSITNIILTSVGERLFNLSFGSVVPLMVFDTLNESSAEKILDGIISAVGRWEDRVIIDAQNSTITLNDDYNSITVTMPYIIKATGKRTKYDKKIIQ